MSISVSTPRRVLGPHPLRPSYLDNPAALKRLEELKKRASALDLVKRRTI